MITGLAVGAAVLTPVAWLLAGPLITLAPAAATAVALAWWAARTRPSRLRARVDADYAHWLRDCEQAHATFRRDLAALSIRYAEDERRYLTQATRHAWSPLGPVTTHRVDVYGGTPEGWQHLLHTAGTSLLAAGTQLTVLDLTGHHVTALLGGRATATGVAASWLTCPAELTSVNPLAGLPPEVIGTVLAEAMHATAPAPDESIAGDADLLRRVATQLDDQPITATRLHTAFTVIHRRVTRDDTPELTKAEYRRVADLLGETERRSAESRQLPRLTAHLATLATITGSGPDGDTPPFYSGNTPLQVVELTDHAGRLTNDLLTHVLFQILVHRLPKKTGNTAVAIAGADRLPQDHLERLSHLASSKGTRLILLFGHLRDANVDLLGGAKATLFMQLANHKEANHAADFIGKEHRFVHSQLTISHSDNTSQSTTDSSSITVATQGSTTIGDQESASRETSFWPLFAHRGRSGSTTTGTQTSTTTGHSTSISTGQATTTQHGTTTSESTGYQRVHEHTVSPTMLQTLPPTRFLLVDPQDPGSPRLGDCDTNIVTAPTSDRSGHD